MSIQRAPIVPIRYLNLIKGQPYHMALAHLVLKSEEYAKFYRNEQYQGSFVIMDNGACEGAQLSNEDLLNAARKVNPSELVLPDVLFDYEETISRSEWLLRELTLNPFHKHISLMVIPQGKDDVEWLRCAEEMVTWPVNVIGVPKWLGKYATDTRLALVKELQPKLKKYGKVVHLLGCYNTMREIELFEGAIQSHYIEPGIVRGIDSSLPYVFAREGKVLDNSLRPSHTAIDFISAQDVDEQLLKTNIHHWCNKEE